MTCRIDRLLPGTSELSQFYACVDKQLYYFCLCAVSDSSWTCPLSDHLNIMTSAYRGSDEEWLMVISGFLVSEVVSDTCKIVL